MNKKIMILVIVFIAIIGSAYVLYQQLSSDNKQEQLGVVDQKPSKESSESQEESEYQKAPNFTVYNEQKEEVQLNEYIGKPIVLNFWASWCGPCQMEMGDFDKMYQEKKDDIHFIMVNMTDGNQETMETALQFMKNQQYQLPILFDLQGEAATVYGAYSLPMTFFIDKDGNAVAHARGAIDYETLQKGIDMIQ